MLSLGQLYTDADTNDDDDDDDNDDDTQLMSHDCIGSLACMPNEPKTTIIIQLISLVASIVEMQKAFVVDFELIY